MVPNSKKQKVEMINDSQRFNNIIESNQLVIIDFYADWCTPCKILSPILEKLNQEFKDINFYKVNVDQSPKLATNCNISKLPTIQFYKNKQKINETIGANEAILRKLINKFELRFSYKHIPVKREHLKTFRKIKYPLVQETILKFNKELIKSGDKTLSLDEDQLKTKLNSIINILEDIYRYHSSKINVEEISFFDILLKWPEDKISPVLNLFRVLVLHPSMSDIFTNNNIFTKYLDLIFSFISLKINNVPNSLAGIKIVINLFNSNAMINAVIKNYEEIMNKLSIFHSHPHETIRSYINYFLLNLTIISSIPDELKYLILTSITDSIQHEKVSNILYRNLVILGTLLIKTPKLIPISISMNINDNINKIIEEYKGIKQDKDIKECATEIIKLISI